MREKDKTLQDIFKEVAEEFNIKPSKVEEVYKSAYRTLAKSISEGDVGDPSTFKFIQLPYLGKFVIKMNRVKYFKNFKGYNDMYPFYNYKKKQIEDKKKLRQDGDIET